MEILSFVIFLLVDCGEVYVVPRVVCICGFQFTLSNMQNFVKVMHNQKVNHKGKHIMPFCQLIFSLKKLSVLNCKLLQN